MAAARAAPGGRACLLRGAEPWRHCRASRTAPRYGEDAHPPRHDEATRRPVGDREPPVIHTDLTPDQETQAALYALGTLAPEEARAFEAHLTEDGCAVCRAQVEAMRGVCDDLAIAPPPRAPSAAVRARVLADAGRAVAVQPPSFAF